ncbi:MAG: cysteine desulfurase family protein [Suipraeoptans sp.]
MNVKEIYFDNSATTAAYEEVGELVRKIMCEDYGNPSSKHIKGLISENYLKEAKAIFAKQLKVNEKEIIFTSGGTESDNMAIIGAARANKRRGKHLITTVVEHPAVYNSFSYLEDEGYEVTYLPVMHDGRIRIQDLKNALREDTILVSLMHVNNEIGTIMPVEEAGEAIKTYDKRILFHIDGIQAYGKLPINLKNLKSDLYSISGHKFHGPKGVGLLYIKDGTKINPIIFGGGQQKDMRSGTENVPGIAGMALASKHIYSNLKDNISHISRLRDEMINGLSDIDNIKIHGGDRDISLPNILSIGFAGIRGEVLLHALEEKGIFVSSGSACSSNHPAISGVLKAIGSEDKYLDSTIRFSFCETNTDDEVRYTIEIIRNLVPVLRRYTRC